MSRAIVCVGVGGNDHARYEQYARRLLRTVKENWAGETMFWIGRYPEGSPSHAESSYAFKTFAMRAAAAREHTTILWMDTTVIARAPIEPLFDYIERVGYVLIGDSHLVRDWVSDAVLEWAGVTRADVPETAKLVSGSFVGLDLRSGTGRLLFEKWTDAVDKKLNKVLWANDPPNGRCRSVSFHTGEFISEDPAVQGSMGDEAILGALAWKYGLTVQEGNNTWCSDAWNGVFQSTGYDGGKFGELV